MKHIYTFFCLFLLSGATCADNVIVGAFGQKLGAVVDEKLEFIEEISTGALKYKIKPDKPYPAFTGYFVFATPVSKVIYSIGMEGEVRDCGDERKILDTVLKQKYPTLRHIVHGNKNITLVQSDKNRKIRIFCTSAITIIYLDKELREKVLEEKASLVDKSNF